MHHQQLLVILPNQGDFQVSDEYLFELAHHMLGAKKPSGMRVGLNIGREMLVGSRGMNLLNRFNNQEVLTKDPEERAWLLASAKPIVVELLRKVYTNDVSKLIPEISVIQPSDKSLDQYRCIDGHFALMSFTHDILLIPISLSEWPTFIVTYFRKKEPNSFV